MKKLQEKKIFFNEEIKKIIKEYNNKVKEYHKIKSELKKTEKELKSIENKMQNPFKSKGMNILFSFFANYDYFLITFLNEIERNNKTIIEREPYYPEMAKRIKIENVTLKSNEIIINNEFFFDESVINEWRLDILNKNDGLVIFIDNDNREIEFSFFNLKE